MTVAININRFSEFNEISLKNIEAFSCAGKDLPEYSRIFPFIDKIAISSGHVFMGYDMVSFV